MKYSNLVTKLYPVFSRQNLRKIVRASSNMARIIMEGESFRGSLKVNVPTNFKNIKIKFTKFSEILKNRES